MRVGAPLLKGNRLKRVKEKEKKSRPFNIKKMIPSRQTELRQACRTSVLTIYRCGWLLTKKERHGKGKALTELLTNQKD